MSVVVLRRVAPEMTRPLKIPALKWIAGAAFILGTLVLYWARWPLTGEVIVVMLCVLPLWFYYEAIAGWQDLSSRCAAPGGWYCIFPTVALLSYIGSSNFGGLNFIPFGWDLLVVAVVGVGFFMGHEDRLEDPASGSRHGRDLPLRLLDTERHCAAERRRCFYRSTISTSAG